FVFFGISIASRVLRLPRAPLRLLLRRIAGLLELRRILHLLFRGGRVRRVGDGSRNLFDLGGDHRLLAALGADALLVGARLLRLLLLLLLLLLVAARPGARTGTAALAGASGTTRAAPALAHRAEALAVGAAAAAALARGAEALDRAAAAAARVLVAEPAVGGGDALVALGHDLALVDPDLHADPAGGRLRLDEAVVDVGADRVQRHTALAVRLPAAHLAAAETARALDLDAGGAGADRRRERTLHRAPEGDTVGKLLGDRLRHELRVELRPLDLVDVDVDVLLRERVQLSAERVDLDAGLSDHDARARGVDVDGDPLLVLLDQDVGQARVGELPVDVVADLDVLEDVVRELLLARVPVGLP